MGRAGAEIVSVNAATIGDDVADGSDEIVMYILVRGDLGMSKGKIAAQAGHAVQRAIRAVEKSLDREANEWLREWEAGSYAKVALRLDGHDWFAWMHAAARDAGIIFAIVIDEGRTAVEPGTLTAVGLQPMPKSVASGLVGKMRLL